MIPIVKFNYGKDEGMFSECKKYTAEQTGIVLMSFDFLFQFFGTLTLLTLDFAIN